MKKDESTQVAILPGPATTVVPVAPASVLAAPTPAAIRDELTNMVIRDLLGPAGGPEEELNQFEDHVYGRYLVGMLAPQDSEIPGGELDELAVGDGDEGEEGSEDVGVPAGSTYFPSSMGMSFVVAAETKEIVVEAEWGQYLRIKSATQQKKDGSPANVWKRKSVIVPPDPLPAQGWHYRTAAAAYRSSSGLVARSYAHDSGWLGSDAFPRQSATRTRTPRRTQG